MNGTTRHSMTCCLRLAHLPMTGRGLGTRGKVRAARDERVADVSAQCPMSVLVKRIGQHRGHVTGVLGVCGQRIDGRYADAQSLVTR